jgi:hypothetical protein
MSGTASQGRTKAGWRCRLHGVLACMGQLFNVGQDPYEVPAQEGV